MLQQNCIHITVYFTLSHVEVAKTYYKGLWLYSNGPQLFQFGRLVEAAVDWGGDGMVALTHAPLSQMCLYAFALAHHFCDPVPNRPWPATGPRTGSWEPLPCRVRISIKTIDSPTQSVPVFKSQLLVTIYVVSLFGFLFSPAVKRE